MYHGDDSGHLILFVNSEIILIDFDQKENNSYSFYIENQLLEFKIEEDQSKYDYVLTPQAPEVPGLVEEKYFDEHFWIPLIILIIAVNLLFLFFTNSFF